MNPTIGFEGSPACLKDEKCVNENGTFHCTCLDGYELEENGVVCNECKFGFNNCDKNAHCADHPFGFSCKCRLGFRDRFQGKNIINYTGAYKQQKSKMSNFEGPYKQNYLFYRFLP